MEKFLKTEESKDDPKNKEIEDSIKYETAIVNDPAYHERNFRIGVRNFLEKYKKVTN